VNRQELAMPHHRRDGAGFALDMVKAELSGKEIIDLARSNLWR
jgi:hypothetical protein